jgi:hypothetical protein
MHNISSFLTKILFISAIVLGMAFAESDFPKINTLEQSNGLDRIDIGGNSYFQFGAGDPRVIARCNAGFLLLTDGGRTQKLTILDKGLSYPFSITSSWVFYRPEINAVFFEPVYQWTRGGINFELTVASVDDLCNLGKRGGIVQPVKDENLIVFNKFLRDSTAQTDIFPLRFLIEIDGNVSPIRINNNSGKYFLALLRNESRRYLEILICDLNRCVKSRLPDSFDPSQERVNYTFEYTDRIKIAYGAPATRKTWTAKVKPDLSLEEAD